MRVTKTQIRKITMYSSLLGAVFFAISAVFFLTSPILDYMLIVALTIAVAPPSAATIIHSRWKLKIERATPEFLRDLSIASRTGIPLQVALEHASKRMYGPLTYELQTLVAHMTWGMNFNEALSEFSKRIDLPLIKKATVLIIEAGKHGGDLSNIFDSTAQYVENVNAWTAKRKMQTMPYVAMLYFSVFIFLFIIIIISNLMFGPMSNMSSSGASFIKPILDPEQARRLFLHTALLESLFGGLIAGKINEENFADGLKHVMILSIASGIAFYLFLH
jgi:flagellar protein FlaJ